MNATSINAGSENIDLHSDFGNVTLEKASGKDITLNSNSGVHHNERMCAPQVTCKLTTDFGDTSVRERFGNSLSVETNSGKVTLERLTVSEALTVQE